MFLCTDSRLRAIGVRGTKLASHGLKEFVDIFRQTDIVLLIDSLQFCVETTNHHIHEAVALYLRPVLHLVRGNVLHITGDIVRRIGIGAL